jgi:HEAT repeat protein
VLICTALVFSTACSGTKRKPVQNMTREELLDAFATETDEKVRAAVVRQIGNSKDAMAVQVLILALKDPYEPIQLAAAIGLGQSGSKEAAEQLWTASNDPTKGSRVRLNAAISLCKLGDVRGVAPLVKALPNANASAALLAMGPAAVPGVIETLRDAATRVNATTVLIALGKPAVAPLIEVARNDGTKSVRRAALKALSEIDDERVPPALDQILKAPDPELTLSTYRYLIRAGRAADEGRLISGLLSVGSIDMAQDFLTSGNPALKEAVDTWTRNRGEELGVRASDLPPVKWGEASHRTDK